MGQGFGAPPPPVLDDPTRYVRHHLPSLRGARETVERTASALAEAKAASGKAAELYEFHRANLEKIEPMLVDQLSAAAATLSAESTASASEATASAPVPVMPADEAIRATLATFKTLAEVAKNGCDAAKGAHETAVREHGVAVEALDRLTKDLRDVAYSRAPSTGRNTRRSRVGLPGSAPS